VIRATRGELLLFLQNVIRAFNSTKLTFGFNEFYIKMFLYMEIFCIFAN